MAVEFLKAGLLLNERCLFVADPLAVDSVKMALAAAGIDTAAERQRGALILTSEREYLVNGQFQSSNMLSFLWQATESARAAGFAGLRATGDVVWQMGPRLDYNTFLEYEKILDTLKNNFFVGLCAYDKSVVPDEYLKRSLRHHWWVVIDGKVTPRSSGYQNKLTGF